MMEATHVKNLPFSDVRSEADRQVQELGKIVQSRATTDLDFRANLLRSPRTTIAALFLETFGHPIPDDFLNCDIRFVESEADLTFVLPPEIDPEAQLSEAELEAVAGGLGPLGAFVLGYMLVVHVMGSN